MPSSILSPSMCLLSTAFGTNQRSLQVMNILVFITLLVFLTDLATSARTAAKTPPMGWMSWERFRCDIDCTEHSHACINAHLYSTMATHLAQDGYLEAGYNTIHIDDCWMTHERSPTTNEMMADPERFPSGIQGLAAEVHSKGVRIGLYTDIGTHTCAGYAGSFDYETIDAKSYAEWGADYLKVDGCYANVSMYESGYPKLGKALQQSGREITYSCSWPAYLGDDETEKPFDKMINAGCNLWRNWHDIDNSWESVSKIIEYFGNFSEVLSTVAGPGHWNDMDMIMAGNDHNSKDGKPVLTLDQARIQLSIWSIMASPLLMSNDLRTVPAEYRDILLNKDMIAVNQDPLGQAGQRAQKRKDGVEIWARLLSNNQMAVVLYNPHSLGDARDIDLTIDLVELSEIMLCSPMWNDRLRVKNVWTGQHMEKEGRTIDATIASMSCLFLVVSSPADASQEQVVVEAVFR